MRTGHIIGFPLILLALTGPACAPLSAADSTAPPPTNQLPGTSAGTVGTLCSGVIDTCGWTALECSGEPDCAHWYSCVLDCHPVHGLQGCFDACAVGQNASIVAGRLQQCLTTSDTSSCGASSDSGAKLLEDAATPSDSSASDSPTPTWSTCEGCISGVCLSQINSCTREGDLPVDCMDYKSLYLACAKAETQSAYEKCLLEADQGASVAHVDFAASGAMACVTKQCSELCAPASFRACVTCSRLQCGDAFDAWLSDATAQDLDWCRNGCQASVACIDTCKTRFGDGAGILSALVACQVQNCASCER